VSSPFAAHVPVVVVGAGACGLTAALAARDAGAEVLVLERDATASGSTALSSGFIPAAGTRWQAAAGVVDTVEAMAADIQRKNAGEADPHIVATVCAAAAPALEWLADAHDVAFVLVQGFRYPGHSVPRMHAVPERTGEALMGSLLAACARAGIDIVPSARVTDVIAARDGGVAGVRLERPDGTAEAVGCGALVLGCSGFGGNRALVREHLPEMADAPYFGHAGSQGDALRWGKRFDAALADLSACQGHGSVATPHNVLITWALMMEGGIQVNALGSRFSNEHAGYSEQCLPVLAQPGGVAWCIFDARLHRLGLEFDDYRAALFAGAIRQAPDAATLAGACGLPAQTLARTLEDAADCARGNARDPFGRDFTSAPPLAPPLFAAKVTGALFHTQGGLVVDSAARVLRVSGEPVPNLLAGGGAARGISGAHIWGYLSGNGLLTAVALGRLAGTNAAAIAKQSHGAERVSR
jgi:fumarate reductase flavoprotein subunit